MENLPYDCLRRISHFLGGEWYTLLFVSKYIRLSHIPYINTRYIGYMSISNAAIRSGNIRWVESFNVIWRQSRMHGNSTRIVGHLENEKILDVIKDISSVEMLDYVAHKLYPNGLNFYTGDFNVRMYKRRLILPRLLVKVAPYMILRTSSGHKECIEYLFKHGLCKNLLPLKASHILADT